MVSSLIVLFAVTVFTVVLVGGGIWFLSKLAEGFKH